MWKERAGSSNCSLAIVVISNLPRNALVEWQVIAYKETSEVLSFDVNSTKKRIGAMQVNKHENTRAITGYLGKDS